MPGLPREPETHLESPQTHVCSFNRHSAAVISLLLGTCWRREYQATVRIGEDDGTTVPVDWAPANCPSCGLVSVNVADLSSGNAQCCHECGTEVNLYSQSGVMPEPRDRRPCPGCGELTRAFSPVEA